MGKRVKVKAVRRQDIDADQLAFVFWTMAKRQVEEKRRREQSEREARQDRGEVPS